MTPAELLREAANRIDTAVKDATTAGHHYAGVTLTGDEWAALLTPQVAAPLAAWLRAEADCAESIATAVVEMPKLMDAIEENLTREPSRGHQLQVSISTTDQAVAFARSILQEEP